MSERLSWNNPNTTRGALIGGLALALLLGPGAAVAASCGALFQQKQYVKAADCFVAAAASIKDISAKAERIRKGRNLRNAAVALRTAARAEKRVEVASFHRERAVALLKQYLAQKLYESAYRQRSTQGLLHVVQKKIGYVPLTIITNAAGSQATLTGYHFQARFSDRWSKAVRPGPYQLQVQYPGGGKAVTRQLQVRPGRARIVVLTKPSAGRAVTRRAVTRRAVTRRVASRRLAARRPAMRPGPRPQAPRFRSPATVLLGVGAAALISGGIVLGLAATADAQKQSFHQDVGAAATVQDTRHIVALHQQSTTMFPIGWVVLGAGGVLAAAGGILLAMR